MERVSGYVNGLHSEAAVQSLSWPLGYGSTSRLSNPGYCHTAVTVLNELPISQFYTKVHFARDTKSVCHIHKQEHTIFWKSLWSAQNLRPPDVEKNNQTEMAQALYKQQDTQSSMKHLRKSKPDTSPKHSDGFHMERNAQLPKSLGFTVSWWRLSSVGFFCLLLYYAYGYCPSFEQASVGIFTWTQRDSASKIYSMEKYNVTVNWLVNTKDILDLTKWLDWILSPLMKHLDSLSYPSSHQPEGEWLDWLDSLSFSFL